MSKLSVLKPKEVLHALGRAGFIEIRSKGSHVQLKKGNLLITVPIHNRDLNPETLKSILRQAKINVEELERLP